uniref:Uncharacterized protein n=1 Tax=Anopheles stephensi TaxID=30069 RepID=A0A182Y920_ANOST
MAVAQVFVVLCALLVGGALGEAALGNYYKDVVREQHKLINEMNQNFTELEKASEKLIDLGFYVGKHKLPPKTVKITNTVAVKVPVPFPVKVPEPVPVPVPVSKPVPVPVPTLVAIPVESTVATVPAVTVAGSTSAGGPSPSPATVADADPASSQAHASTVQVQDWKNITTSTTSATMPSSIRHSRSIINIKAQRKRDLIRARNSTTGDMGPAPNDSTMSVVLKFKPVRIRLQSSDLSLMRSNRRPNRMTSGTPPTNSTRPRLPVPRIRPIPLRQASPEANLHRLRRRPSAKTTALPASSSSSSSSSSEDSTENLTSRQSNSVEEEPEETLEDLDEEELENRAEEESSEERSEESEEVIRKPVRTRTSGSAKQRTSTKRTTKRPRYRDSKVKAKRDSRRDSKRGSKKDYKRHTKRDSKRDSKQDSKRDSKRSKLPKKVRTVTEPAPKAKKSAISLHARSKLFANRTRAMKSPILIATAQSPVITTTTTTTTPVTITMLPIIRSKVLSEVEVAPAASSPRATITQLSPSRTDLLLQQPHPPPEFYPPPPQHTVTRYRGNANVPGEAHKDLRHQADATGEQRFPFYHATKHDPHLARSALKPHHADAAAGGPSYQLQQQYGEHAESQTGGSAAQTELSGFRHIAAGGYNTYTEHHNYHHHHHYLNGQQHDRQKHKGSYGARTVKPTVLSVPSDAHLYPGYNQHHDHHHHGSDATAADNHAGKFHYHFHNVHPVGGGAGSGPDHHESAASEQYAVHTEYGGVAGPDGSVVTSYDPPASGNTFHFHDDGTGDMFAGASTVQEQHRAPYEEESSSYGHTQ